MMEIKTIHVQTWIQAPCFSEEDHNDINPLHVSHFCSSPVNLCSSRFKIKRSLQIFTENQDAFGFPVLPCQLCVCDFTSAHASKVWVWRSRQQNEIILTLAKEEIHEMCDKLIPPLLSFSSLSPNCFPQKHLPHKMTDKSRHQFPVLLVTWSSFLKTSLKEQTQWNNIKLQI